MAEICIPHNWKPRDYQAAAWNALVVEKKKRACLIWHRRAGKDALALNYTATALMQKPATYWHMLPEAAQARKAVWEALNPKTGIRIIDQAFPREIRDVTRENEMFIRFKNGSTFQVVGSDNFDSLIGSPPAGVVFSEWALADPRAWAFLRPILAENDGWAIFITTPRGRNHAYRTLQTAKADPERWFWQVMSAKQSGAISPEILTTELREYIAEYGEDDGLALYQQEYDVSFDAAIVGSYFSRQIAEAETQGRVGFYPYKPGSPVYTSWDIGIGAQDQTAIWFIQKLGNELRAIDYGEWKSKALFEIVKDLNQKPYSYGGHVQPHDANNREKSGATVADQCRELGLKNIKIARRGAAGDTMAVNRTRNELIRCTFNQTTTKRGLDCLINFRREWDDDAKAFKQKYEHDWASHGASAFCHFMDDIPSFGEASVKRPKSTGENSWMVA